MTFSAKPTVFPEINHNSPEITAIAMTVGTKTDATLSAILATGAFVALASSRSFTISEITVSPPIPVTLNFTEPSVFTVPVNT